MRRHLLRVVHRVTGLSVALPLVLLVVTGVPLQFTSVLGLGQAGVPFSWVHRSYSIEAPQQARSINEVMQLGDTLLTPHRAVKVPGVLLGAEQLEQLTVAATSAELLLIPHDAAAPVERIRFDHVVRAFGIGPGYELGVTTSEGPFRSADFGASWRAGELPGVTWFSPDLQPTTLSQAQRYRASHLSWERWLQDLHSGRFFGEVGVWVMALAAALAVALSITGFFVWFSSRRAGRMR